MRRFRGWFWGEEGATLFLVGLALVGLALMLMHFVPAGVVRQSPVYASSISNGGGGGGGTGNAGANVTTTFSATPTFTCPSATAGTVVSFSLSTALTANITSSTLAGCNNGALLNFVFLQDATGGRTVAMPTAFDPAIVNPSANITTKCTYFLDGSGNGRLTGGGCVSTAGFGFGSETGAPGTPPALSCFSWLDSTNHIPSFKCNTSAIITSPVVAPVARTANQFLTNLSAGGVFGFNAIAQADLPATSTQTVGTATLVVPVTALAGNSCDAAPTTVTVTGANPATDNPSAAVIGDPTGSIGYGGGTNGGITLWPWITANTINVKRCNQTANSITPGALSLLVKALR